MDEQEPKTEEKIETVVDTNDELEHELEAQPEEKPRRRRRSMMILRIAALSTLGVLLLISGLTYSYLKTLGVFSFDVSRLTKISNFNFKDNTQVFDRKGNMIAEFYDSYQIYTPIEHIPKEMIDAVIAIEDKRFYEHHGVDFKAIGRAAFLRLKGSKTQQGASTLTQQVVRHLFLTNEKTIERKILEIAWSLEIEKRINKNKILEIYLNTMFLGNGSYGVAAAAKRYFSKDLKDLSTEQYALLAGLFQSPSRYNPMKNPKLAKNRQKQVLFAMQNAKIISSEKYKELLKKRIRYRPFQPSQATVAEFFVDYVKEQSKDILKKRNLEGKGLRIFTTLDPEIHHYAELAIQNSASALNEAEQRTLGSSQAHLPIEAASVITNPNTGEILSMIGGRDYKKSQYNRAGSSLRSPGSAFKPVVYATALQSGLKWNDVLLVSPINVENYRPKNYSGEYLTESTMFRSFYRSLNSPTVDVANQVGLKKIINKARDFGFESPLKDEMGTALGSSDATLLDMARIYGVFANNGNKVNLVAISKIESVDGKVIYQAPTAENRTAHVLSEAVSYMMVNAMKAVLRHGTGYSSHDLANIAAGKTGTSNQSTDNWFCGFTRDLVSIVWVGSDDHSPIFGNQTGGTLALPIWDHMMRNIYANKAPRQFDMPEGVVLRRVDPVRGFLSDSGIEMPFLISNQPQETSDWQKITSANESNGYRNVFRK